MINSSALNDAIKDFQPDGGFGKRHIHTLPYKVIPRFNKEDPAHELVVEKTKNLIDEWVSFCKGSKDGAYIEPDRGTLNSRRKKLQAILRNMSSYDEYEKACNIVMGIEE